MTGSATRAPTLSDRVDRLWSPKLGWALVAVVLVGLLVVLFRFTQRLLSTLTAIVALVVMLTRTDLNLLALRATFDLPFYVLVFGAATLELQATLA